MLEKYIISNNAQACCPKNVPRNKKLSGKKKEIVRLKNICKKALDKTAYWRYNKCEAVAE